MGRCINEHHWSTNFYRCLDCGKLFEAHQNEKNAHFETLIKNSVDPKCECGVDSIQGTYEAHSDWCPKYKPEEK